MTVVVPRRPFSGGGGTSRLARKTKLRPTPARSNACSAISQVAPLVTFAVVSFEGGTNEEDAAAAAAAVSSSFAGWFRCSTSCACFELAFAEGPEEVETPSEGAANDWSKSAASRRYACRSARAVRRSMVQKMVGTPTETTYAATSYVERPRQKQKGARETLYTYV